MRKEYYLPWNCRSTINLVSKTEIKKLHMTGIQLADLSEAVADPGFPRRGQQPLSFGQKPIILLFFSPNTA